MDVEEPFFPGYVFCRFDVRDRMPVLNTPGVVSIIGIGKTPAPVEDAEIAALQGVVKSGCSAQPWPFLHVGQYVRIDAGPLTGLVGRLVEVKKSSRLVISVTLLQRSVAVEIDPLWAYPVSGSIQGKACSTFVLR
jgi:transcription antitermination factor NusG